MSRDRNLEPLNRNGLMDAKIISLFPHITRSRVSLEMRGRNENCFSSLFNWIYCNRKKTLIAQIAFPASSREIAPNTAYIIISRSSISFQAICISTYATLQRVRFFIAQITMLNVSPGNMFTIHPILTLIRIVWFIQGVY